jgi:hypothetical protein
MLPLCKHTFKLPSSGEDLWQYRFMAPKRPDGFEHMMYGWSLDFHAAPIACSAVLWEEAGAVLHAEVDFHNCKYFASGRYCATDKLFRTGIRNRGGGFSLDPCPNRLRRQFYERTKASTEFQRVDFFLCSHPSANCELFLPLNKSIVVFVTTRLEFARNDSNIGWRRPLVEAAPLKAAERWRQWVRTLRALSQDRTGGSTCNSHLNGTCRSGASSKWAAQHIVLANSEYDVKYIKYMSGIDAEYLPSWCGDRGPDDRYRWKHNRSENFEQERQRHWKSGTVLIGDGDRLSLKPTSLSAALAGHPILQSLNDTIRSAQHLAHSIPQNVSATSGFKFQRLRVLYPQYTSADLSQHPAIIFIPHQTSFMSFFEAYRMCMPIFVPSIPLALRWHRQHDILRERVYGQPTPWWGWAPPTNSSAPDQQYRGDVNTISNAWQQWPDPNDDDDDESVAWWLQWADYYVMPHVNRFDSWEHLLELLRSVDLWAVSEVRRQS